MPAIALGNHAATPPVTFTASSVSPATFARTPMVDTIASFAVNPERDAATGCHSPNPRGNEDRRNDSSDRRQKTVRAVLYHSKTAVGKSEAAEEPHYYACKEQNRSGFDDKAFQSFPYMEKNCSDLRNVILRKLHNKRRRPFLRTALFSLR